MGILLIPNLLCAEPVTEIAPGAEVVATYPKVVARNDTERTFLAYRDRKMELYRSMVDKYGPNIKMEDSVFCTSILGMAAAKNDTAEIERLISLGADMAICDNRPIGMAIMQGRGEALKLLLEAGARVDQPNKFGKRPLEIALEQFPVFTNYDPQPGSSSRNFVEEYIAIVELLVKHGADTLQTTSKGLAYADFFNRQFDGMASIHPDYEKYKQDILRLIDQNKTEAH